MIRTKSREYADDDVDALKPSFCPHLTEATRQASSQRERGQQREIDLHPSCSSVFDNDDDSNVMILMIMIIMLKKKMITIIIISISEIESLTKTANKTKLPSTELLSWPIP